MELITEGQTLKITMKIQPKSREPSAIDVIRSPLGARPVRNLILLCSIDNKKKNLYIYIYISTMSADSAFI